MRRRPTPAAIQLPYTISSWSIIPRALMSYALVGLCCVACSSKSGSADDTASTRAGESDDTDVGSDAGSAANDDSAMHDDEVATSTESTDASDDADDGTAPSDDATQSDDSESNQPDIADEPPVGTDDSSDDEDSADESPDDSQDEPTPDEDAPNADDADPPADDAELPLDDDLSSDDTADDTSDDSANADDLAPIDPAVWESTEVELVPTPSPGNSWNLPTADSLNSTPAALARFEDSIVLAGARQQAGADDPNVGEAFVARLNRAGAEVWSTALPDSGFPHDVVVDEGSGEIIVMTPYSPDSTFLNPSGYNDQFMLIRLEGDGNVLESATRDLGEGGDIVMGMAMDAEANVFITGAAGPSSPVPFLAKYDATFSEQWVTLFEHTGSQAWTPSITMLPGGDVAITGSFDATVDFGGETLTSLGMSGEFSVPNGFVARFDNDGGHVFSFRFGGTSFDNGVAIASLGDDLIVGCSLTGVTDVGGMTVQASEEGSVGIARIDPTGAAKWVEVIDGGYPQQIAVHEPSGNIYVAGRFNDRGVLMNYDVDGQLLESAGAVDGEVNTYDIAIDIGLGVWLTGIYSGSVDFGNDNLLTSDRPGVFLVRLSQSFAP